MTAGKYFTLAEFEVSEWAARRGLSFSVPAWLRGNVVALVAQVLDPLRADLGRPVVVLSGYRPPWLNKAVGGSLRSEHMEARAADIVVPGVPPLEVCRRVVALGLPFNQLILEFGSWCHVSVPAVGARARGEVKTAVKVGGRTVYRPGLVGV